MRGKQSADLVAALREAAAADHPQARLMRHVADKLETAREGYLAEPPTVSQSAFSSAFVAAYHVWETIETAWVA